MGDLVHSTSGSVPVERGSERKDRLIGVGMCIAAGIIADFEPVYCEEIIRACGWTTIKDLKANGVDEYDIKLLYPVMKEIARKDAIDARKACARAA